MGIEPFPLDELRGHAADEHRRQELWVDKWDVRFLQLAAVVGGWSKDPSTKVGAVVVDPQRRVVSVGYNGFPRGCSDATALYANRERKLRRTIHAERNALMFAARPVAGCTVYTHPFPPCAACAASLIQSGVTRVVAPHPTPDLAARWGDDLEEAREMFREAGVLFEQIG